MKNTETKASRMLPFARLCDAMRRFALSLVVVLALARDASAGMPSLELSDLAELRLQTISFFLVGLLISAKGIQWLWNGLRADFNRLPKLTYRKSVGLTVLWGLAFIIVLTMISGARELMTPGAWRKEGLTYQLSSDDSKTVTSTADRELRRRHAERLADGLAVYAQMHEGQFPESADDAGIPKYLWDVPVVEAARYQYVTGLTNGDLDRVIAYEPVPCDQPLFVITADGRVLEMQWDALRTKLAEASP